MGWLSNFFSGVDDLAHNELGAWDDLAHFDGSGFEDRATHNLFNIMENDSLRDVAMPLLDAFTFGLGSSVANAEYNKKKYGEHNIDGGQTIKNMASGYLANAGANYMGYTPASNNTLGGVAYNTGRGAVVGGAASGLAGNSVQEGAKGGAIGAGVPGAIDYGVNTMSSSSGNQSYAPWAEKGQSYYDATGTEPPQQSTSPWAVDSGGVSGGYKTALSSGAGESNPFFSGISSLVSNLSGRQWGTLGEGLLGMYSSYEQRKRAKEMLSGLAGRRSGYEQQLQKDLLRRDAAAGRRSNYGGRAVELQSNLAKLDSQNAPLLAQLHMASSGGLSGMFQSGLRTADKMGWLGKPNPTYMQYPSFSSGLSSLPQIYNMATMPSLGEAAMYPGLTEMSRGGTDAWDQIMKRRAGGG